MSFPIFSDFLGQGPVFLSGQLIEISSTSDYGEEPYYTVLYNTALAYSVVYCTVLSVLYCTILYCIELYSSVPNWGQ